MDAKEKFCKLPITRTKAYNEAAKGEFAKSIERKSVDSSDEKRNSSFSPQHNLLDLAKNDNKVRLWESILTGIISVTKEFEHDLTSLQLNQKNQPNPFDNDKLTSTFIEEKAKNKIELKLEQLIFNAIFEKKNFIKIVDYQSPIRKLSSKTEQRNDFIEKRLKVDKKFDFSISLNITDFAPELFHLLRMKNGIRFEHIYDSFSIERNFDLKIADTKEFLGKSDSIFFFSSDNKFVLKSISESNFLSLINRMKEFFEYFTSKHEDSFLVKIFGAYTMEIEDEKVNLILMENLFTSMVDNTILRIYDLKGSKHNRAHEDFLVKYKEQKNLIENLLNQDEEIELTNEIVPIIRGTDIDFLNSDDVEINFKKGEKDKFNGIVESDANFLSNINIMDYSLLFIKAMKGRERKEEEKNSLGRFRRYESADGKYGYCFAIVDYLQTYDLFKVFETNIKSFFIKSEEISCRDPLAYSDRFLKFVSSLTKEEGE